MKITKLLHCCRENKGTCNENTYFMQVTHLNNEPVRIQIGIECFLNLLHDLNDKFKEMGRIEKDNGFHLLYEAV